MFSPQVLSWGFSFFRDALQEIRNTKLFLMAGSIFFNPKFVLISFAPTFSVFLVIVEMGKIVPKPRTPGGENPDF